jgi:hypothetical protein
MYCIPDTQELNAYPYKFMPSTFKDQPNSEHRKYLAVLQPGLQPDLPQRVQIAHETNQYGTV